MRRTTLTTTGAAAVLAAVASFLAASITASADPTVHGDLSPAPTGVEQTTEASPERTTTEPTPTPTEDPTPGAPAALTAEQIADLPLVNDSMATAVNADLLIDPDPNADATDDVLLVEESIPAYADPEGDPIGRIDPQTIWDATRLPVFAWDGQWAMVAVFSRVGLPSEGVVGQAVAWLWAGGEGVRIEQQTVTVVVDTAEQTLTIRDGDRAVYETTDLAVGTSKTPTPTGRTAVVSLYTDPAADYTQGETIFALSRYSDARDAFTPSGTASGTQAPPLIALHHHGLRADGSDRLLSNGCVRLSVETIAALEQWVEPGVVVYIR